MDNSVPNKQLKQLSLTADPQKILPKLCNRILMEVIDTNTILTFIYEAEPEKAIVIDRIVVDQNLRRKMVKLLATEPKGE